MFGKRQEVKNITIDELVSKNLEPLIDIREVEEYELGHVPGAKNIPMMGILMNPSQFLNKETTYYIICRSGGRSLNACQTLQKEGYDVVNVLGGTIAYFNSK